MVRYLPRLVHSNPVDPGLAPGSGQSRGQARLAKRGGRGELELEGEKVDTEVHLHNVPVPQDPNAERIAQLLAPQVRISSFTIHPGKVSPPEHT